MFSALACHHQTVSRLLLCCSGLTHRHLSERVCPKITVVVKLSKK